MPKPRSAPPGPRPPLPTTLDGLLRSLLTQCDRTAKSGVAMSPAFGAIVSQIEKVLRDLAASDPAEGLQAAVIRASLAVQMLGKVDPAVAKKLVVGTLAVAVDETRRHWREYDLDPQAVHTRYNLEPTPPRAAAAAAKESWVSPKDISDQDCRAWERAYHYAWPTA